MSEVTEAPWIRAYALTPRRLTEGGWVWLRPYEWRWQRPASNLPSALNPPQVFSRKGPRRALKAASESR